MGNNIIIAGFSNSERLLFRQVSWSGVQLQLIKEFTDPVKISPHLTPEGIGYLTGKINSSQPAYKLHIENVIYDDEKLIIYYDIIEKLNITSSVVWKSLRNALSENNNQLLNLPFCALIDKSFIKSTLDDETLIQELKKLTSLNKWNEIIQLFPQIEKIENIPHLWNNKFILNYIAFASAKLSETSINVNREFPDKKQRINFLQKKAKYRNLTLKLRKRLIELEPDNPTFYSNLAYTHYQNCIELTTPGGRRDSNLMDEAQAALNAFDKSLYIDPNRINDSYRKGRLLIKIIAPNILFTISKLKSNSKKENINFSNIDKNSNTTTPDNKNNSKSDSLSSEKSIEEHIKSYFETINLGIETLKSTFTSYETIPIVDEKSLIRYKKEYIKALYNIANGYSALVPFSWNYLAYLNLDNSSLSDSFELDDELSCNISKIQAYKPLFFKTDYAKKFLDYITNSLTFIEKCIYADAGTNNLSSIIQEASQHGIIDAVYKLYSAAKINLKKYFLIKAIEKVSPSTVSNCNTEILNSASLAEQLFKQALKINWKPEFAKQSKAFIAEKLARLYIDTKRYSLAIDVIKPFLIKKVDYYIRYTFALAAILKNEFSLAKEQLSIACKEPRNQDLQTGELMLSYINKKLK